jgi:hypothetical protein
MDEGKLVLISSSFFLTESLKVSLFLEADSFFSFSLNTFLAGLSFIIR